MRKGTNKYSPALFFLQTMGRSLITAGCVGVCITWSWVWEKDLAYINPQCIHSGPSEDEEKHCSSFTSVSKQQFICLQQMAADPGQSSSLSEWARLFPTALEPKTFFRGQQLYIHHNLLKGSGLRESGRIKTAVCKKKTSSNYNLIIIKGDQMQPNL